MFRKEWTIDELFRYGNVLSSQSLPVNSDSALSVLCLLLYSARFIRIETKFNNYEQRLKTVDEREGTLSLD